MLSDQDLDHLRELIIEFKLREAQKWDAVEFHLGVSRHKIKKFVSGDGDYNPPYNDIRAIYTGLQTFLHDNPRSRINTICSEHIDALYTTRKETDQYQSFKSLARISEDEQSTFSKEIAGSFLTFRRHKDDGIFISHVRALNTHARRGLAICRVARKLSDGGDLVIDCSAFKKNNRVYVIGYERASGDVRSMQLLSVDESYDFLKGFVSGFEISGEAFVSRVIVARMTSNTNYEKVRGITGLVSDQSAVRQAIEAHIINQQRTVDALALFECEDAYSFASIGI